MADNRQHAGLWVTVRIFLLEACSKHVLGSFDYHLSSATTVKAAADAKCSNLWHAIKCSPFTGVSLLFSSQSHILCSFEISDQTPRYNPYAMRRKPEHRTWSYTITHLSRGRMGHSLRSSTIVDSTSLASFCPFLL